MSKPFKTPAQDLIDNEQVDPRTRKILRLDVMETKTRT